MKISNKLKGYELLDATCGERLERWGKFYFVRPDPQIIWNTQKKLKQWNTPDAKYIRSKTGGGHWEFFNQDASKMQIIEYENLKFWVKPMNFKHMGIFPEQAVNWELITKIIKNETKKLKILNVFGYTGSASLIAAKAGAEICHVDSAKGMINWGKNNLQLSKMEMLPIRWFVDDCFKFVKREIKRGNKYDGIILDPPSYGNGPRGEIWKFENNIYNFLEMLTELLNENFSFILFNLYVGGFAAGVIEYLLFTTIGKKFKINLKTEEIGIAVKSSGFVLPCGLTCIVKNIKNY